MIVLDARIFRFSKMNLIFTSCVFPAISSAGEGLHAEPLRPGIGGDGAQQEDGFNANESFIQRTGHGQVPAHDVQLTREASRVWVACQRANSGARADQFGHNLSADIAGCCGN